MRSKPNNSSMYWDSYDSGSGSSGSAASRNYVDPWDLENYAYLRRYSIAAAVNAQPAYQRTIRGNDYSSRLSHHSPVESDYWYAPSVIREPGYDAPASVEEIYFRPQQPPPPARPLSCCYHQQPIYEDDMSHYAAPIPLYTRLSELEHEELRTREMIRRRSKLAARSRNYLSREECYYHRRPSETLMEAPSRFRAMEEDELLLDEVEVVGCREPSHYSNKTSHITLNTYGHLKIDYTNSWNSLHRKIVNK